MLDYWGIKLPKVEKEKSSTLNIEQRQVLVSEPKALETIENRIYFYAEVDRANCLVLNKNLREMGNLYYGQYQSREMDSVTPIYLHINSFGGSIFSGLAVMDEILRIRERVPVVTIIDGCCASAATFLGVVGTRRVINPNAFVMIHQLTSVMWGKYAEFEDHKKNLDLLMERVKTIYGKYTKVPMDTIDEILEHDLWFPPEKCLELGIVDSIG